MDAPGRLEGHPTPGAPGWLRRNAVITAIVGAGSLAAVVGLAGQGVAAPSLTVVVPTSAPASTPSTTRTSTVAPPAPPPAASASAPSPSVAPTSPSSSPTDPVLAATWMVTKIVDGDTIWVSRDGVTEKVRFIGIDTPEVGECGYAESSALMASLVGGRSVTLTAGAQTDRDRYDRLLRYVDVAGTDAGLTQIQRGEAVSRYDSRDGYGAHPREAAYVAADAASAKAPCAGPAPSPPPSVAPAPAPAPATSKPVNTAPTGGWVPGSGYSCPAGHPIKGNEPVMIAHPPSSASYAQTKPEKCFATMADAIAAGFRAAKD